jgi:hypothetical protein
MQKLNLHDADSNWIQEAQDGDAVRGWANERFESLKTEKASTDFLDCPKNLAQGFLSHRRLRRVSVAAVADAAAAAWLAAPLKMNLHKTSRPLRRILFVHMPRTILTALARPDTAKEESGNGGSNKWIAVSAFIVCFSCALEIHGCTAAFIAHPHRVWLIHLGHWFAPSSSLLSLAPLSVFALSCSVVGALFQAVLRHRPHRPFEHFIF